MSFPLTYKKRKKLRHKKHKIEADQYRIYLNSEQWQLDFKNWIKQYLKNNG